MNSISFACPLCSGVFQIDTQQESSQVYCPHCSEIIDIPKQDTRSNTSESSSTTSSPESEKKSKRPRKRSRNKSASPAAPNNTDLFPPGYVPDSPAVEPPDNSMPTSTTAASPAETVETPSPAEPPTAPTKPTEAGQEPSPSTSSASQLPQPTVEQPVTAQSDPQAVESLLPPGVGAGSPSQEAPASTPSADISPTGKSATVEHLLPASVAAANPSSSAEDPFAGIDLSAADGTSLASDSNTPQIALLEPVKTVAVRGQEFELKQRTPEEKSQWRRRKNLVMWISGISILLGTLFAMKR